MLEGQFLEQHQIGSGGVEPGGGRQGTGRAVPIGVQDVEGGDGESPGMSCGCHALNTTNGPWGP